MYRLATYYPSIHTSIRPYIKSNL